MSKPQKKRSAAKEVILDFLKGLYEKERNGHSLTPNELDLISSKKMLEVAVYQSVNNKICELGITDKANEDGGSASSTTIYQAINELLEEGKIEFKFHRFQYRPTEGENLTNFPILKVASEIPITPLPVQDLVFYRTGAQYASWITNYINAQFLSDDIYAVALGDVIMCMDFQIPSGFNSVAKRASLSERLTDILKTFDVQPLRKFDDADGYNEVEEMQMLQEHAEMIATEQRKGEEKITNKYGGKVTTPKRNVKKR